MLKTPEGTKSKKQIIEDIYSSQDIQAPIKPGKLGVKWLIYVLLCSFLGGFVAGFVYFNYFTFLDIEKLGLSSDLAATSTATQKTPDLNFLLKENTNQEIKLLAELKQPLVGFYKARPAASGVFESLYLEKDFLGSGVVITSDGWVLTHKTVLNGGNAGIAAVTANRKVFTPEKYVEDKFSGLVLVHLPTTGLSPVKFTSTDLMPASSLLAFRYAVAAGGGEVIKTDLQKISYHDQSKGEDFLLATDLIDRYYKINQEVASSFNGAPLLNEQNEVAGLLFASGKDYINLAVPSYYLKSAVDKFLSDSQKVARAGLGVRYLDLSEVFGLSDKIVEGRNKGAVLLGDAKNNILAVTKGSAAEKAGLKAGDIILKVNNEDVDELNSLTKLLQSYSPNQEINLTVFRKGEEIQVKVVLGSL